MESLATAVITALTALFLLGTVSLLLAWKSLRSGRSAALMSLLFAVVVLSSTATVLREARPQVTAVLCAPAIVAVMTASVSLRRNRSTRNDTTRPSR